jgi:hypothetical protein
VEKSNLLKGGTPRRALTPVAGVADAVGKDDLDGNANRLGSGNGYCGKGIW